MILGALMAVLFAVGASCNRSKRKELEEQHHRKDLEPIIRSLSFDGNPPTYADVSQSKGTCILTCRGIWKETKKTLLPGQGFKTRLEFGSSNLVSKTNDALQPNRISTQKSKVSYQSITEGWSVSASLNGGTGMLNPVSLSLSGSWGRSGSSTVGGQTSEVTTSDFDCPAYSRCYIEAITASVTITGWCQEHYRTDCELAFTGRHDRWDTCTAERAYVACSIIQDMKKDCHKEESPQPCELTVPLMEGDKPWTHQYETYERMVPQALGLVEGGWCQLSNGEFYNMTSGRYRTGFDAAGNVVEDSKRELPDPVDLSQCGQRLPFASHDTGLEPGAPTVDDLFCNRTGFEPIHSLETPDSFWILCGVLDPSQAGENVTAQLGHDFCTQVGRRFGEVDSDHKRFMEINCLDKIDQYKYHVTSGDAQTGSETATNTPPTAQPAPSNKDKDDSSNNKDGSEEPPPGPKGEVLLDNVWCKLDSGPDDYIHVELCTYWDPNGSPNGEFKPKKTKPIDLSKCGFNASHPSPCTSTNGCEAGTPVQASFSVFAATVPGETIKIVGDADALGQWDPAKAVELRHDEFDEQQKKSWWSTTLSLEVGEHIEYKYVHVPKTGAPLRWEGGRNRNFKAACTNTTQRDSWQD